MKAVTSTSPISVGQSVSAELPNITAFITGDYAVYGERGATVNQSAGVRGQGGIWNTNSYGASFNASRCSSIYKDSATTVVPESLITNFYIKY